jgi:hypothetical protein
MGLIGSRGRAGDGKEAPRFTCLHLASMNGHVEVARRLLDKGARVNAATQVQQLRGLTNRNGSNGVVA